MTEPQMMAFPFCVISPSQRPKVPRPETCAACRSDQADASPYFFDIPTDQNGAYCGAVASYPASSRRLTTRRDNSFTKPAPKCLARAHRSEGRNLRSALSAMVAGIWGRTQLITVSSSAVAPVPGNDLRNISAGVIRGAPMSFCRDSYNG